MEWIVLAVIGLIVLTLVIIYNRLVSLRQARQNAFADIDVQLKLRYDLVPNLVETVKGYATHEKGLLEEVTQARSRAMSAGGTHERLAAEAQLSQAMFNVLAVAENYPQLQADANFRALQAELSDIENKISAARRYFNNSTNEYNTAVQSFPAVLVAGALGFRQEEFFALDALEKQAASAAPKVTFG